MCIAIELRRQYVIGIYSLSKHGEKENDFFFTSQFSFAVTAGHQRWRIKQSVLSREKLPYFSKCCHWFDVLCLLRHGATRAHVRARERRVSSIFFPCGFAGGLGVAVAFQGL